MEDIVSKWVHRTLLERTWELAETRLRWFLLTRQYKEKTPQVPRPLESGDLVTALLQPGTALPPVQAHRHQPWAQKEVSLEEAAGFLRVHPTRVALAQHVWRACGDVSIGRATEILVLHHRAAAKVHTELTGGS